MNIRCSSLPLTMLCGQSASEVGLRIGSPDQEAADMGTAVHEIVLSWIQRGYDRDLLHDVAVSTDLDEEEMAKLAHMAWNSWKKVAEHFPDPRVEEPLRSLDARNDVTITGHCDLFSVVDL